MVTIRANDERAVIREKLAFEYSFVSVGLTHLEIQLHFEDPTYVSRDDYLIIYFYKEIFNSAAFYEEHPELLMGVEELNFARSMDDYDRIEKQMPAQMS